MFLKFLIFCSHVFVWSFSNWKCCDWHVTYGGTYGDLRGPTGTYGDLRGPTGCLCDLGLTHIWTVRINICIKLWNHDKHTSQTNNIIKKQKKKCHQTDRRVQPKLFHRLFIMLYHAHIYYSNIYKYTHIYINMCIFVYIWIIYMCMI